MSKIVNTDNLEEFLNPFELTQNPYMDGDSNVENNEETGPEETTITVFENDTVSIVRHGQFSSEMMVEKNVRHHTFYSTPYGELTMGIYGSQVEWSKDDKGGVLKMKYSLDFNNGFVSENTMKIYIEEK